MAYGNKIKAAREAKGWSQIKLAEEMGYTGRRILTGQKLVSDIENSKGPRGPSMPTRKLLGEALGLDVEGNPLPSEEPVNLKVDTPPADLAVFAFVAAGDGTTAFDDQGYSPGDGMYFIGCPPGVQWAYALALEVRGDSMEPKYQQGQVIVADRSKEPGNGEFAVVRVDDVTYIKRWRKEGRDVVLESMNPAFGPIRVPAKVVKFEWKVVWAKEK